MRFSVNAAPGFKKHRKLWECGEGDNAENEILGRKKSPLFHCIRIKRDRQRNERKFLKYNQWWQPLEFIKGTQPDKGINIGKSYIWNKKLPILQLLN